MRVTITIETDEPHFMSNCNEANIDKNNQKVIHAIYIMRAHLRDQNVSCRVETDGYVEYPRVLEREDTSRRLPGGITARPVHAKIDTRASYQVIDEWRFVVEEPYGRSKVARAHW